MPSILGWLIVGMLFGPHAFNLMPKSVLDAGWYKTIIMRMQCAFGVMLGSELIWNKLKHSGKALIITTLVQSLGTFVIVSLAFGIIFAFTDAPIYLAFVFGGIAPATAPAPALSIVNKFCPDWCCGRISYRSSAPPLVQIVQGTIATAAVINEFIAVIAAKKGFELASEIKKA